MVEAARTEGPAQPVVVWEPRSKPQEALLTCPVFEVFFGGSRGSLKTDGVLGDWLSHSDQYKEHAIGLMVRRKRTSLMETYERAKAIYQPVGFKFNDSEHICKSPAGARLRFSYLERDADAEEYQGHSYTRVYIEEIGNFPSPKPILKLMATLRSGHGVPCGFRATGNPGGPGHQWVKKRYIDDAPLGWKVRNFEFTNPFKPNDPPIIRDRVFIPGRITDHNLLGAGYIANLQMSGSASLVKAWLEGDWGAIEGAFFDQWSTDRHVIEPFPIPDYWLRFAAFDWGFAAPFCVHWWAVAGDDHTIASGAVIPRGALVCYREWYGGIEDPPNVGIRMDAEEIAAGILRREHGESINYRVADPAIFAGAANNGGPGIAERMAKCKVLFRRGDNTRVGRNGAMGGWDQFRARLLGKRILDESRKIIEDGPPMAFWFETCEAAIRTIPALQHDEARPEDINTDSEDHCFAAGTMVDTSRGPVAIENLPASGLVRTTKGRFAGLRPYRSARLVKRSAETVWLTFSDGRRVRCTPDHKFMLTSGDWVDAQHLAGKEVQCIAPSLSAPPSKSSMASAITSAATTFSAPASAFTGTSGSAITAPSRTATTSTIWTRTAPTTSRKTWRASPPLNTSPGSMGRRPASAGGGASAAPERHPRLGIEARPDWTGTASITTPWLQSSGSEGRLRVSTAASSSWPRPSRDSARTHASRRGAGQAVSTTNRGPASPATTSSKRTASATNASAPSHALGMKGVRCISIEPAPPADVYCITVPSTGRFTIEGGLVVANCADCDRYGFMSRPYTRPKPLPPTDRIKAAIAKQPTFNELRDANRRRRERADA